MFFFLAALLPAGIISSSFLYWWVIAIGLVVKFFFVYRVLGVPPKKAIWVTTVANVISILAGILLIPIVNIVWIILYVIVFHSIITLFSPVFWVGAFLLTCLCNVWLESLIYRHIFKIKIYFKDSVFWWCMLANGVILGLGLAKQALLLTST